MVATDREWISPTEFMKRHGLGKNLVYDKINDGTLAHVRVGKRILVASDALDRLYDESARGREGR